MSNHPSVTSRSILGVMLCTALSRIMGFVRIAVIGRFYGAEGAADVLHLVFQIPNNLRRLLAEGALSSAFLPVFSSTLLNHRWATTETRLLLKRLFGLQWLIFLPLLTISVIFSQEITGALFDFPTAELTEIADNLFKILVWHIFPISIAAVIMAVLHSHRCFIVPAMAPILFSITVISAILLLHRRLGIYAVSVGVLLGGSIQVVVQLPHLIKLGYGILPRFSFRDPLFRKVMRSWGPVTISAALFSINQQIASYFASGLEEGSASAMINALTFWHLPFGLLGISVLTVLYPRMSNQRAIGNQQALRDTLEYGISYLIVTVLPATIYLLILPRAIIGVALQRGAFTAHNTLLTSRMLFAYSCALLPTIIYYFVQRFYYSCYNYRRPIYAALIVFIIDIALSLWLKETALRVVGLAYANSIAFSSGLIYLLIGIREHIPHYPPRYLLLARRLFRVAMALLLPTSLLIVYALRFGNQWLEGGTPRNTLLLGLFTILYICSTLLCYRWFQVQPAIHRLLRRR